MGDHPSLVIATQDINQLIPQLGVAIGPDGEALYNAGVELLERVIDLLPWDDPPTDPFLAACRILLTRIHAHLLAGRLLIRGGFVVDATLSARAAVEALWLLDYLNTDKSELRRWLKGEYISAARVRNALSESALRHRIYDELCAQSHPNQTGLLIYTIRPGQVRALTGEQGSVVPYGAMRFYSLLLLLSHTLVQCHDWLAELISWPTKWESRMLVLDEQIAKYQNRLFRRARVPPDAEPVFD